MNGDDELKPEEWRTANLEHLKLAVNQYEKRFKETTKHYADLDGKSRWVLSVSLPTSAAVAGYLYSKISELESCEIIALGILGIMVAAGTAYVAMSSTLQEYSGGGMTPKDMRITEWKEFLAGERNETKEFYGMRIAQFADSIRTNEQSNTRKSRRLKWGIRLAVCSLPVSAIGLLVCIVVENFECRFDYLSLIHMPRFTAPCPVPGVLWLRWIFWLWFTF